LFFTVQSVPVGCFGGLGIADRPGQGPLRSSALGAHDGSPRRPRRQQDSEFAASNGSIARWGVGRGLAGHYGGGRLCGFWPVWTLHSGGGKALRRGWGRGQHGTVSHCGPAFGPGGEAVAQALMASQVQGLQHLRKAVLPRRPGHSLSPGARVGSGEGWKGQIGPDR